MFFVRGTKKLLDRVGGTTAVADHTSTTVLGDWYATVLFWRPHVALFVNEPTRLPVFVAFAPAKTLVPRFVSELAVVFASLGLDPRFIAAEVAEMTNACRTKTTNRSVVGSMTELALLADYHRRGHGTDLRSLSLRLARTPSGPLRRSRGCPDRELRDLVERIPGLQ